MRYRKTDGYEDVLHRDESSDRLAVKSVSPSGNLLTDEVSRLDNIKVENYIEMAIMFLVKRPGWKMFLGSCDLCGQNTDAN